MKRKDQRNSHKRLCTSCLMSLSRCYSRQNTETHYFEKNHKPSADNKCIWTASSLVFELSNGILNACWEHFQLKNDSSKNIHFQQTNLAILNHIILIYNKQESRKSWRDSHKMLILGVDCYPILILLVDVQIPNRQTVTHFKYHLSSYCNLITCWCRISVPIVHKAPIRTPHFLSCSNTALQSVLVDRIASSRQLMKSYSIQARIFFCSSVSAQPLRGIWYSSYFTLLQKILTFSSNVISDRILKIHWWDVWQPVSQCSICWGLKFWPPSRFSRWSKMHKLKTISTKFQSVQKK